MHFFCDDGSTYVKLAWREANTIKTHTTGNSFREGWKTDLFGTDAVFNFLIDGKKYTHDIASTVRVKVVVASVDSCCQRFSLRIQPYFLLPAPVSRLA